MAYGYPTECDLSEAVQEQIDPVDIMTIDQWNPASMDPRTPSAEDIGRDRIWRAYAQPNYHTPDPNASRIVQCPSWRPQNRATRQDWNANFMTERQGNPLASQGRMPAPNFRPNATPFNPRQFRGSWSAPGPRFTNFRRQSTTNRSDPNRSTTPIVLNIPIETTAQAIARSPVTRIGIEMFRARTRLSRANLSHEQTDGISPQRNLSAPRYLYEDDGPPRNSWPARETANDNRWNQLPPSSFNGDRLANNTARPSNAREHLSEANSSMLQKQKEEFAQASRSATELEQEQEQNANGGSLLESPADKPNDDK